MAAPGPHPPERAHHGHRLEMGSGLDPAAQDGQIPRLGAGQRAGRHPAHRRGTNGGDAARVHDRDRRAGLRRKQQDQALVGIEPGTLVLGEHPDGLEAEGRGLRQVGRHDPEDPPPRRDPEDRAQRQGGLAARQGHQRGLHQLHALRHGEQLGDLRLVEDSHAHGRYRSTISRVCPVGCGPGAT